MADSKSQVLTVGVEICRSAHGRDQNDSFGNELKLQTPATAHVLLNTDATDYI